MSFSSSVKNEICTSVTGEESKYACFYGMILFCRQFAPDCIVFQTENDITAEMFCKLADDIIGGENIVSVSKTHKKNNVTLYSLAIENESDREELIYRYHIYSRTIIHRIQDDIINEENVSPFLGGAFLSCGSMTEPLKEYHLEFVVPFAELAEDMLELLNSLGINAKLVERKNDHVIYMKESESIEDMLTWMAAPKSSIELMNVKILKDIRNKTNRITNCDNANIERTLKAAEKQIEDIEYIERTVGLDYLPRDLMNMAEVRLDNPEVSLKDLGELLDKPLGRSGANHRLKKISAIADKLREERGELTINNK
ncbi:MAG: DNA-binding protein WhiA [Oscillospiraceae bacterium]|nr:DNA-binding protein WhiA [Oscillospiraceae bacterium]